MVYSNITPFASLGSFQDASKSNGEPATPLTVTLSGWLGTEKNVQR